MIAGDVDLESWASAPSGSISYASFFFFVHKVFEITYKCM